jgi:hypothetical protein
MAVQESGGAWRVMTLLALHCTMDRQIPAWRLAAAMPVHQERFFYIK